MKFQLVLQWPCASIGDYDGLIEIENTLIAKTNKAIRVDGHDAGSGEMNIFIHTNDPLTAFEEVRGTIGSGDMWTAVRVAYREIKKDDYTILWPEELKEFRVT